jgi:taurine dioxygenase
MQFYCNLLGTRRVKYRGVAGMVRAKHQATNGFPRPPRATSQRGSVEIRPVGGVIGAEVSEIDLQHPLSDDQVAQIEKALIDHLVLFFRHQALTDQGQRDFAARFGPLDTFPLAPPVSAAVPELHMLSFETGGAALGSHVDAWHTDGTFMRCPPMGTVLRAVELPPYGGDTCWANMYAAYDALSPAIRRALDGLVAVHDYTKISYTTFDHLPDPDAELLRLRARYPVMRHPVVRVHPVTGRRLLFVHRNYTVRIEGLTERENEVLLPYLCDHVRDPLFQCRFQWTRGAVAFWDNRATQHYAVPDYVGRRVMHRVVITGDEVVGVQAEP